MNRSLIAAQLRKIAKSIMAARIVPKAAPDTDQLERIQFRVQRMLEKMPPPEDSRDGYRFYYQNDWGSGTPGAAELKKDAEAIQKIMNDNDIPLDTWGHGSLGHFYNHDSDYSWENRGYSLTKGAKGFFTDPDWVNDVIAEYGGESIEIPDSVRESIEFFTAKGDNFTFQSPKQGAFYSFKAVEFLDELKKLPEVKITGEKLTKSRNNPQYYSTIEYEAAFGRAAKFKLSIGWSGSYKGVYKRMSCFFRLDPKYKME